MSIDELEEWELWIRAGRRAQEHAYDVLYSSIMLGKATEPREAELARVAALQSRLLLALAVRLA